MTRFVVFLFACLLFVGISRADRLPVAIGGVMRAPVAAPFLSQAETGEAASGEEESAVGGFVKDLGMVLIIFGIVAQIAARMWIYGMLMEEDSLALYIIRVPLIGDLWALLVLKDRLRDLGFPLVMSVASLLLLGAGMSMRG